MRWTRFFLVTISLGLVQVVASAVIDAAWLPFMPSLLLACAVYIALECETGYMLPALWWCGFVQDILLGGRLGSHTLLYAAMGLPVYLFRHEFPRAHPLSRLLLLAGLSFLCAALATVLDARALSAWQQGRVLLPYAISAGVTVLAAPALGLLLDIKWLRPWRDDLAHYGLLEG